MTPVFNALSRAIRDLFQFKVLLIVIWPIVAATLLWLVVGAVFWDTFSGWIDNGLAAVGIQSWLEGAEPRWIVMLSNCGGTSTTFPGVSIGDSSIALRKWLFCFYQESIS